MNVSSKSRYALTALVELDLRTRGDKRPVRLVDLAHERGIPEQFLEQVFAVLRRAGVLRSQRGVGGGFAFARSPDQVTVLEVVEALDGTPALATCTSGDCAREDSCGPGVVWRAAAEAFESVLSRTTISELTERERQLRSGEPMYEI